MSSGSEALWPQSTASSKTHKVNSKTAACLSAKAAGSGMSYPSPTAGGFSSVQGFCGDLPNQMAVAPFSHPQLPPTRTFEVMSANEIQLHSILFAVIITSAVPQPFDFVQRFDVQVGPTSRVRHQHAQHRALVCVWARARKRV